MTMTSVKNKIGGAMINAGAGLTVQGEHLAGKSTNNIRQSILNIDLAAPKGTGFNYTRTVQTVRFK